MPRPPSVSFITRYLFENFWPGAIILLLAAAMGIIIWKRDASRRSLLVSATLGALAVLHMAVAMAVSTSGERARAVVTALVDAAVAADVPTARAQFSRDATMSFGAADNPAESIDFIQQSLEQLRGRYTIADNRITHLRSYSVDRTRALVHLRVITRLEEAPYAIPTSWVLSIARQDDGSWKIEHITFIEYAGQTPGRNVFR
jgi:hypothetical protein